MMYLFKLLYYPIVFIGWAIIAIICFVWYLDILYARLLWWMLFDVKTFERFNKRYYTTRENIRSFINKGL